MSSFPPCSSLRRIPIHDRAHRVTGPHAGVLAWPSLDMIDGLGRKISRLFRPRDSRASPGLCYSSGCPCQRSGRFYLPAGLGLRGQVPGHHSSAPRLVPVGPQPTARLNSRKVNPKTPPEHPTQHLPLDQTPRAPSCRILFGACRSQAPPLHQPSRGLPKLTGRASIVRHFLRHTLLVVGVGFR